MATVLVIDDSPGICNIIKGALRKTHETFSALTLGEAKDLITRVSPQVVLVDQMLPDGNGIEFVKSGVVGDASSVLITAHEIKPEIRADLLDLGFLYVVQKPFDIKEIQAIVSRSHKHWETKTELRECRTRISFRPESVKKLREAVSAFRETMLTTRVFF
jgi:DNA-binding response OmpR family regulator